MNNKNERILLNFGSIYPPHRISCKWRFIGIPLVKMSCHPGGDCHPEWAVQASKVCLHWRVGGNGEMFKTVFGGWLLGVGAMVCAQEVLFQEKQYSIVYIYIFFIYVYSRPFFDLDEHAPSVAIDVSFGWNIPSVRTSACIKGKVSVGDCFAGREWWHWANHTLIIPCIHAY